MLTYIGKIATWHLDRNNNRIDQSALAEMANGEQIVPVTIFGDRHGSIGHTTQIEFKEDFLMATMELKSRDFTGYFAVPTIVCNKEDIVTEADGTRKILKGAIVSLGLTLNPADDKLTPVQRGDDAQTLITFTKRGDLR